MTDAGDPGMRWSRENVTNDTTSSVGTSASTRLRRTLRITPPGSLVLETISDTGRFGLAVASGRIPGQYPSGAAARSRRQSSSSSWTRPSTGPPNLTSTTPRCALMQSRGPPTPCAAFASVGADGAIGWLSRRPPKLLRGSEGLEGSGPGTTAHGRAGSHHKYP